MKSFPLHFTRIQSPDNPLNPQNEVNSSSNYESNSENYNQNNPIVENNEEQQQTGNTQSSKADHIIEQYKQIKQQHFDYLQELENDYVEKKLAKIRSKLTLYRYIKIIQRAWRNYKLNKKNVAAKKIQLNYKLNSESVKYKSDLLIYLKRKISIQKVKRWLIQMFKRQRIKKAEKYDPPYKLNQYNLIAIITIQKFIKGFLARKILLPRYRELHTLRRRKQNIKFIQLSHELNKSTMTIDHRIFELNTMINMETQNLNNKILDSQKRFSEEWQAYEKRLL